MPTVPFSTRPRTPLLRLSTIESALLSNSTSNIPGCLRLVYETPAPSFSDYSPLESEYSLRSPPRSSARASSFINHPDVLLNVAVSPLPLLPVTLNRPDTSLSGTTLIDGDILNDGWYDVGTYDVQSVANMAENSGYFLRCPHFPEVHASRSDNFSAWWRGISEYTELNRQTVGDSSSRATFTSLDYLRESSSANGTNDGNHAQRWPGVSSWLHTVHSTDSIRNSSHDAVISHSIRQPCQLKKWSDLLADKTSVRRFDDFKIPDPPPNTSWPDHHVRALEYLNIHRSPVEQITARHLVIRQRQIDLAEQPSVRLSICRNNPQLRNENRDSGVEICGSDFWSLKPEPLLQFVTDPIASTVPQQVALPVWNESYVLSDSCSCA